MRLAPRCMLVVGLCLTLSAVLCNAQITYTPALIPARITTAIDDNDRIQLRGNVDPLARLAFDRGPVADAQALHRMLLLLRRSSDQESSLLHLLDEQQSKFSPSYQRWLTPDDFGKQFGVTDFDLQTITQWLSSQGFVDIHVGPGRTAVEFSGNVGQVRNTFHTEIHQYEVNGESYLANATDPQIPAALAAVISGIVSLHNFPVQSHLHQIGTFHKSLKPVKQNRSSLSRVVRQIAMPSGPLTSPPSTTLLHYSAAHPKLTAPGRESPSSAKATSILRTSSTSATCLVCHRIFPLRT